MRILHVVESFSTGVFTVIKQLANGCVSRGDEVGIAFSVRWETPADFAKQLDSRVELFQVEMKREVSLLADLRALRQVLGVVRRFAPDATHAHSSKGGVLGRLAALLYGFPRGGSRVFYSPHGFSFLRQDVSRARRGIFLGLEQIAYRFGGTIVGCSYGEAEVAKNVLRARRVAVVENGVAAGDILPAAAVDREGEVRIVTAGRISPQKNPRLFGALAKQMEGRDVRFVWIGGGEKEDEAWLRSIPNVSVTGWLPRGTALKELAGAQMYLQTSLWEGMPVSVIEAMIAGLPAVVTDVVGNRDVVAHGQTGFIGRNQDELANAIERLVADRSLRRRIGAQARINALERFDVERFVSSWRSLYQGGSGNATGTREAQQGHDRMDDRGRRSGGRSDA
jgi:glycosyltransferase involved in cell wall biosynthesis